MSQLPSAGMSECPMPVSKGAKPLTYQKTSQDIPGIPPLMTEIAQCRLDEFPLNLWWQFCRICWASSRRTRQETRWKPIVKRKENMENGREKLWKLNMVPDFLLNRTGHHFAWSCQQKLVPRCLVKYQVFDMILPKKINPKFLWFRLRFAKGLLTAFVSRCISAFLSTIGLFHSIKQHVFRTPLTWNKIADRIFDSKYWNLHVVLVLHIQKHHKSWPFLELRNLINSKPMVPFFGHRILDGLKTKSYDKPYGIEYVELISGQFVNHYVLWLTTMFCDC